MECGAAHATPAQDADDLAWEGGQLLALGHVELHASPSHPGGTRALQQQGAFVEPAFKALAEQTAAEDNLGLRRHPDGTDGDLLLPLASLAEDCGEGGLEGGEPCIPRSSPLLQRLVHPDVGAMAGACPQLAVTKQLHPDCGLRALHGRLRDVAAIHRRPQRHLHRLRGRVRRAAGGLPDLATLAAAQLTSDAILHVPHPLGGRRRGGMDLSLRRQL
mmetsp:Transcript_36516/g.101353  ORF Transcript_36516/g.101353 Transcript_36516/m.101353 type:complete len:217 (+) Transcript_36516:992-1642(+)